jgi:hypothetical protein
MTIYFEDGELKPNYNLPFKPDYRIDAGSGFSNNIEQLEKILASDPGARIYTNSLAALCTKYGWCANTNVPLIFIRQHAFSGFNRIDYLTRKEIRQDQNILHIYISGGFQENE